MEKDKQETINQIKKQLAMQLKEIELMRKELDQERRLLEHEKTAFENEQKLFDMKLKILQDELANLAEEKEKFEKQKNFYRRVNEFEEENYSKNTYTDNIVKGDMFFTGVRNKQTLKKRYKDLLKIYHPDNLDGDNETIQEINSEYSKLSAVYK